MLCEMREPFEHREKNLTMKSLHVWPRIVWFVLTFCAVAAWAQDTASITGTITDPSGAAVPNAQVAVRNAEHGINRSSSSNGSGDFLFPRYPSVPTI